MYVSMSLFCACIRHGETSEPKDRRREGKKRTKPLYGIYVQIDGKRERRQQVNFLLLFSSFRFFCFFFFRSFIHTYLQSRHWYGNISHRMKLLISLNIFRFIFFSFHFLTTLLICEFQLRRIEFEWMYLLFYYQLIHSMIFRSFGFSFSSPSSFRSIKYENCFQTNTWA